MDGRVNVGAEETEEERIKRLWAGVLFPTKSRAQGQRILITTCPPSQFLAAIIDGKEVGT
jgi:hypothetical protein